jgi:hypothetical protein
VWRAGKVDGGARAWCVAVNVFRVKRRGLFSQIMIIITMERYSSGG